MKERGKADSNCLSLGVITEEFGAYSTVFVQRQIDALAHKNKLFVACWLRSNPEVFDFEPVYPLKKENIWLSILRRAQKILPRKFWLADIIASNRKLARLIDHYQPKFLHIHFGWSAARIIELLDQRKIPFSLVIHGTDINQAIAKPHSIYAQRLCKAFKLARVCLFVSEDLYEKALQLGCPKNKAKVFYLGVPVPDYYARSDVGSDNFKITCIGRLIDWKGHSVLLRSLARLIELDIKPHLTIIGQGPLRSELVSEAEKLKIDDRVTFLEKIDNQEIYQILVKSDLYAHPSLKLPGGEEGLGLAIQEAMAVGLPVVATATGGIPESVEDGQTGFLVPPDDAEGMALAIHRLAENPALRRKMGDAGRQRVERYFNMDYQNNKLLELIRSFYPAG